jgi:sterol 3beta-glucosyltransferase
MIHKAGAGPVPIPHKHLTSQNLRDAIQFALSPGAKRAAARMAEVIKDEVCKHKHNHGCEKKELIEGG